MTNHNRNWERTHRRIAQAVFALWSKKPINKITVNEVCQIVGINRSTFYEHFDSIYAVSDETGADVYNVLLTFFYPETGKFYLSNNVKDGAIHFLKMIKADQSFYRIYFAQMNVLPFGHEEELYQRLYDALVEPYHQRHPELTNLELDYMLSAFESSIAMILRQWTQSDFKDPESSLARVITMQPLIAQFMDDQD